MVLLVQQVIYSWAKIHTQAITLNITQFGSSKLLKFNMRFYIKKMQERKKERQEQQMGYARINTNGKIYMSSTNWEKA
jgi:hypothetical protein